MHDDESVKALAAVHASVSDDVLSRSLSRVNEKEAWNILELFQGSRRNQRIGRTSGHQRKLGINGHHRPLCRKRMSSASHWTQEHHLAYLCSIFVPDQHVSFPLFLIWFCQREEYVLGLFVRSNPERLSVSESLITISGQSINREPSTILIENLTPKQTQTFLEILTQSNTPDQIATQKGHRERDQIPGFSPNSTR